MLALPCSGAPVVFTDCTVHLHVLHTASTRLAREVGRERYTDCSLVKLTLVKRTFLTKHTDIRAL